MGAPVWTRTAWRGCSRIGVRAPASIEPITGRLISTGYVVLGPHLGGEPSTSTLRTA